MGIKLVLCRENTRTQYFGRIAFENRNSGLRDYWPGINIVKHEV